MGFLTSWWSHSALMRVSVVLGAVTTMALGVIVTAVVFTEQSVGKGSAINVSGSLRMQSYVLALAVASPMDAPGRDAEIRAGVAEFERRLTSPGLVDGLPRKASDPLAQVYAAIRTRFADEERPLALAAIESPEARLVFIGQVGHFVEQVDGFVRMLEVGLESRMNLLRMALAGALVATLLLGAVIVVLLNVQVFKPLKDLDRTAQAVRAGRFAARARETGPDEIGQLGQAFNFMIEDLARLYGSLEAQVADKTADLDRRNRSLALLYETTRLLAGGRVDGDALKAVLARVEDALGVEGGMICAHHAGSARGYPLAVSARGVPVACREHDCGDCSRAAPEVRWHTEAGAGGMRQVVSVPLTDSGVSMGAMPLVLAPGRTLEPWQIDLAETVGRHIGAALAAAARMQEGHTLAVLKERSIIARELHDSIAQSLSYTKIQLVRLAALLREEGRQDEVDEVVAEVRQGVSTAYRQLRELLTTFRLKVGQEGLQGLLEDAVAEFRSRTGLAATLDNRLIGLELGANEQVHVLQIVREALSNTEKHAHARKVWVRLDRGAPGEILVEIEDDGVGLPARPEKPHHFGLSIMRDRAEILGGALRIEPLASGGTRVALAFRPASAPAASGAPVS